MLERLQKVLAAAGVASRRDAEEMISAGRVQVDGQPVTALGTKVDPDQATILVDGRPITPRPAALYLALHKPAGFDSTRGDPHAAHTVMELVLPGLEAKFGRGHPSVGGLHPVGRLDRDSEGLLLLTNDGAFTHALTHPSHGVPKTYVAEVSGQPTAAELEQLRNGVVIEGRTTRPARVRLLSGPAGRNGRRVELELREGRKRQVRLMLAAVGHPARRLVRTAVGPVALGSLKPGQYRMLTPAEVRALLDAAAREEPANQAPPPAPLPAAGRRPPARADYPAAARKMPAPGKPEQPGRTPSGPAPAGSRRLAPRPPAVSPQRPGGARAPRRKPSP
jgi:23S rRNA pseudouridine2605 synthase